MLEREGSVIRIETLNAWITANGQDRTIVTICEACGGVVALPGEEEAERLCGIARAAGFAPTVASIELRGRCGSCRETAE
jgi:Fe2+ or Zn2+ uptake regulation protein